MHVGRFRDGRWTNEEDHLAVEEPLEIRVDWNDGESRGRRPITVTMRTPGNDFELAAGFLYGEGIVRATDDIDDVNYCREVENEDERCNTVLVKLRRGVPLEIGRQERNFTTTSACGVCGKASLSALAITGCSLLPESTTVTSDLLTSLPATLRKAQSVFDATGGLHAAGLFDGGGNLLSLREDVGRHNALDKLVGAEVLAGTAERMENAVLLLSGRASFELLQKALMARIQVVAAVGAPSTLAVQVARTFNITLAGFVRPGSFNVYSGQGRVHG